MVTAYHIAACGTITILRKYFAIRRKCLDMHPAAWSNPPARGMKLLPRRSMAFRPPLRRRRARAKPRS
jgi:hypothetical protein